jgi:hypothetical protein
VQVRGIAAQQSDQVAQAAAVIRNVTAPRSLEPMVWVEVAAVLAVIRPYPAAAAPVL